MNEDRAERLQAFVDWTKEHIIGDEKGQAQIFLDRLFQAFKRPGLLEVGGHPEFRIKKSSEDGGGTSFADYVWKPVVLIEMKKRGADLARCHRQAFDYWIRLAPGRPQFTVLCNFDEFWVYDFNEQIEEPMDKLALANLPTRYGPLAFLFPTDERPTFQVDRIKVTRGAADLLAECFRRLAHRKAVGRETAQRFILQMLIALFSEDIGLLPKYFVTTLLAECTSPSKSYDLLGCLFTAMNTPGGAKGGRFKDVQYFNGGIFAVPTPVELEDDEAIFLRRAAQENWSAVSPDIFGTIFQHSMDAGERHALGAHYTAQIDIMKIVGPTIVEPWRNLIENATKLDELRKLQERLYTFTVLDPACGSGNFLYIAYRELKRLEAELIAKIEQKTPRGMAGQRAFGFLRSKQFFGIDIIPFAVELAKVTMTLAHKLAIDELHIDEPALPLDNLDKNILCTDALIVASGVPAGRDSRVASGVPAGRSEPGAQGTGPSQISNLQSAVPTPWPKCDVVIGNPPFLGSRYIAKERGYPYERSVRTCFPDVPKMADYCIYWLRRAHDHLPDCTPEDPVAGRAGLVGTQNIRNNQSRVGGLDYIVKSGVIVDAIENQPWSGEADVHVSIVNWVKTPRVTRNAPGARHDAMLIPATKKLWHKVDPSLPLFTEADASDPNRARKKAAQSVRTPNKRRGDRKDKSYELAPLECLNISSTLSGQLPVDDARVLASNTEPKRCYVGQYPFHDGFLLEPPEAAQMISDNPKLAQVIFPYMIGRDLIEDSAPSRWIIDFAKRDLLEASRFGPALERVKKLVMPTVLAKATAERTATGKETTRWTRMAERWWQFRDYQPGTMAAIANLPRYVAASRVTKRPIFAFVSNSIHPDNTLMVFPLADDYSFGILQSNTHWQWFTTKCSKLTERFRYTAESVFDTFPWPQSPTKKQIDAVAAAGREVRRIRAETLPNIEGGLRALYRTLELPGKNPLKDAHSALDAAVLEAYGFTNRTATVSERPPPDLLKQLLDLNLAVAAKIDQGLVVTPPGVPADYPNPAGLVTNDCITP